MDQRGPPDFILEAFADPNSVRDVVRGILHTIFFLRYFTTILPQTRDVLGLQLAYVPEAEIETLIDQRVAALVRQLESERHTDPRAGGGGGLGLGLGLITGGGGRAAGRAPPPPGSGFGGGGGRGQITVQFLEKRRRKTWYAMRGDDEVPWESWTVKVTVADPRTEGERAKVRKASETTLHNTILKAVTLANAHKDHIPPITTDVNPFPYQILVSGGGNGGGPGHQKEPAHAGALPGAVLGTGGIPGTVAGAGAGNGGTGTGTGPGGAGTKAAAAASGWATRMGIY